MRDNHVLINLHVNGILSCGNPVSILLKLYPNASQ